MVHYANMGHSSIRQNLPVVNVGTLDRPIYHAAEVMA
ncbi:hypothetical protein PENNAL_c0073G06057, partial [Penicillium nalgiovense]